jgi:hypothetical protein
MGINRVTLVFSPALLTPKARSVGFIPLLEKAAFNFKSRFFMGAQ